MTFLVNIREAASCKYVHSPLVNVMEVCAMCAFGLCVLPLGFVRNNIFVHAVNNRNILWGGGCGVIQGDGWGRG